MPAILLRQESSDDQISNSTVRYLHIGSGRYVSEDLFELSHTITDGSFFVAEELTHPVDGVLAKESSLGVHRLNRFDLAV